MIEKKENTSFIQIILRREIEYLFFFKLPSFIGSIPKQTIIILFWMTVKKY